MSSFGSTIKISIFGESHGPEVGVILEGVPSDERIDLRELQTFLDRRAPGRTELSSARKEADVPEFLSGVTDVPTDGDAKKDPEIPGEASSEKSSDKRPYVITNGTPIRAIIRNTDVRSSDYENLRTVPRPGHADFPAFVKYHGQNDFRGGGQFSARLTAPMCVAGGILLQILARRGVRIGAHIAEIAGIRDDRYDPADPSSIDRSALKPFPVLNDAAGEAMKNAILSAKQEGDSVGGIVECMITGLPAGLGEPLFGSFEGILAQAVFGIPAVKGIEFGAGFEAARMRGSENNDPYYIDRSGSVRTAANNHGGILGGLTSGMPVIFRAAFKPTPSIALPQKSVDLISLTEEELIIHGRHDPCVVPRAVPCVIAAAALAVSQIMF